MHRTLLLATILAFALSVFGDAGPAGSAQADRITPEKGKVGQNAVIHGAGFRGGSIDVKFGQNGSTQTVIGVNDNNIKVDVPNRNPQDANPVTVTVSEASVTIGSFLFEYKIPEPEPIITSFDPASAPVSTPFTVTLSGTDFTTAQGRFPDDAYLVSRTGPDVFRGSVESFTIDSAVVAFPPVGTPGDYTILVGFSDGAAADTSAQPPFRVTV
jgi:hypothetical protein